MMKSFSQFLSEDAAEFAASAAHMPIGTIYQVHNGSLFNTRTFAIAKTATGWHPVDNFVTHQNMLRGTLNKAVFDIHQPIAGALLVVQGIKHGDVIVSTIQMDCLPSGSVIESTDSRLRANGTNDFGEKTQARSYMKRGDLWYRNDQHKEPKGLESFWFEEAMTYKYVWKH